MIFADCFWPGTAASTSALARQTGGMHNDVAMSSIQTSLAALQVGSALVATVPYIALIASLLLQILTMRDARPTTMSF